MLTDDVADQVRSAFATGYERTLQHDFEYGIREIVDIAVKALSPGINDPTTAINCIDRLAEILVLLGNRRLDAWVLADQEGQVRFVGRRTDFARALRLNFDQIRVHGDREPAVTRHLSRTLRGIAECVPPAHQAELVDETSGCYD